ncbi:MAG TPA: hypothetical protein VFX96_15870 [Pyrinomonadaceae bacterium]|nr:hypothetical protein [Pyrinomonadaceae bacterium]
MQNRPRHTLPSPLARALRVGARGALVLRPFGTDERDLAVDFTATPRPLLVTEILELCTERADGDDNDDGATDATPSSDFFWELTVGRRIEALVALADEGAGVYVMLRCPFEDCARELELEISLEELSELQQRHADSDNAPVRCGEHTLHLRRPRGRDQLTWLGREFADAREAAREMILTLAVEEESARVASESAGEELAVAVSEVMEEFDPLVNFSLRVRCHFCGGEAGHALDLEEYALSRLRRAQGRLLASVHRLASRYHWDERQIFSVPHWRRAHYLSLITGEEKL